MSVPYNYTHAQWQVSKWRVILVLLHHLYTDPINNYSNSIRIPTFSSLLHCPLRAVPQAHQFSLSHEAVNYGPSRLLYHVSGHKKNHAASATLHAHPKTFPIQISLRSYEPCTHPLRIFPYRHRRRWTSNFPMTTLLILIFERVL